MNKIVEELINKMFAIAGIDMDYSRVVVLYRDDNKWLSDYSWSQEQNDEFKAWAISYISKKLRIPKYKGRNSAKKNVEWFLFVYGLTIR